MTVVRQILPGLGVVGWKRVDRLVLQEKIPALLGLDRGADRIANILCFTMPGFSMLPIYW